MKLLLTSAGLRNQSIIRAFETLVDLPKEQIKIAFIPTAANVEEGDKDWLIDDLYAIRKQEYSSVDIVDISALDQEFWVPRIEQANVIFVGGGNTFHLMHWMNTSGLGSLLPVLLETRVYVGISAGSCVTGPTIYNSVQNLFGETYKLTITEGLGLVDFQFIPHFNSPYFERIREENLQVAAQTVQEPVYVADDNTAIQVRDGKVSIISEGKYLTLNV